jgi:Arc/MetJ-type ribon-helix-helix transcriptional regulator
MTRAVEENVKRGHFASKSEFFRMLFRAWAERALARDLEESRKEFRQGKGKELRSLKDLR